MRKPSAYHRRAKNYKNRYVATRRQGIGGMGRRRRRVHIRWGRLSLLFGGVALVALLAIFVPRWIGWIDASSTKPGPIVLITGPEDDAPSFEVPNIIEGKYFDLSAQASTMTFNERSINQPVLWGEEMLFSAGTGSPDKPILKKLYLYNFTTQQTTVIAETKINYGEIYEPLLNDKWIIWLDTDQGGTNKIYSLNRATGETVEIKSCKNGRPKLRLYENVLIWTEQVSKEQDKLYLYDMVSQENIPIVTMQDASTYGVSAPSIYQDTIIWAAPDPSQTAEERALGEKSAICSFRMSAQPSDEVKPDLGTVVIPSETADPNATAPPEGTVEEDPLVIDTYLPGMYVHEPLLYQNAYAWIDRNKAPNSNLYVSVDRSEPKMVDTNVTAYVMGDGFLVYGRSQRIWAYFWESNIYACLSGEDTGAMLPFVYGNKVGWYDGNAQSDNDTLKIMAIDLAKVKEWERIINGPSAQPTPMTGPDATASPSVSPSP